jgi:Fe-S-cluster containining protein
VDRLIENKSMVPEEFATKIEGFEPYVFQMKKTVDGSCVFLRNGLCSIYEARPLICRFYPFQLQNHPFEKNKRRLPLKDKPSLPSKCFVFPPRRCMRTLG